MPGLTAKQQRFVEEYLVDLNAAAAARRAGYSAHRADAMGFENLRKPELAAAIFERRAKLAEQTGRTVAAVMADIGRVRDDAMKPVTDPETGETVMLSHKDALKALELEGKHLGAFTDKLQVTGPGGGPVQSVSLTADEFLRIAAEVAARV
jgi:phage terminase small subunit